MKKFIRNQRGIALAFVALTATLVLGLSSYVVDLAMAYSYKTRVKNATDLATLAAVSQIQGTSSISTAKDTALTYLNNNLLSTIPGFTATSLGDSNLNIQCGTFDSQSRTFTWDESDPDVNAIMVSYTYNVMSFFGPVLMLGDIPVSGSALASKQPAGYLAPGSGFPLSLYSSALDTALSSSYMVDLYSAGTMDNSFWTDYTASNPSTNDLAGLVDYLQYMIGDPPPAITVNDSFAINDGGMGAIFMDLDPAVLVGMTYLFTVIEDGASNSAMAQGFVGATIDNIVDSMGDKYISVTIIPGYVDNQFGGSSVGGGSNISSGGSSLLADSFTLVN